MNNAGAISTRQPDNFTNLYLFFFLHFIAFILKYFFVKNSENIIFFIQVKGNTIIPLYDPNKWKRSQSFCSEDTAEASSLRFSRKFCLSFRKTKFIVNLFYLIPFFAFYEIHGNLCLLISLISYNFQKYSASFEQNKEKNCS